jgi:hypothetical protein
MIKPNAIEINDVSELRSERTIAEFTALRQEIEYRTNAQLALISLNVTAVGAIAGFALTNASSQKLIIILAMACPSLGLLWVDHAITIENIGDFIRDRLEFRWEFKVLSERKKLIRRAFFVAQIFLLFAGPSIASLVLLFNDYKLSCCTWPGDRMGWGWGMGAGLVVAFTGRLFWYLVEPRFGGILDKLWKAKTSQLKSLFKK